MTSTAQEAPVDIAMRRCHTGRRRRMTWTE